MARVYLVSSLVCFGLNISSSFGFAEEYPWLPEYYPQHLRTRLSQTEESLQVAKLSNSKRWYVDRLKAWDVNAPIPVCFFGGAKELRKRIAEVASLWTRVQETRLPLDFGDADNPRICKTNEFNDIRVGYEYNGYWSLVGQDSIEHAAQGEQSMNLGRYNVNPPPEPTFTRVVLHEFGHAIGFHHEHQNPVGPCEHDFDWPVIEAYLRGPPNYWDQETIDFNMKSRFGEGTAGPFDYRSIMLYAFPKKFYKAGTQSRCFTEANTNLSDGDRKGLAQLYPRDTSQAKLDKQEALKKFREAIDSNSTLGAEAKAVAVLRAGELTDSAYRLETLWALRQQGPDPSGLMSTGGGRRTAGPPRSMALLVSASCIIFLRQVLMHFSGGTKL